MITKTKKKLDDHSEIKCKNHHYQVFGYEGNVYVNEKSYGLDVLPSHILWTIDGDTNELMKIDSCTDSFDIEHRVHQYDSFYILKYASAFELEEIQQKIHSLEHKLLAEKLREMAVLNFPKFLVHFGRFFVDKEDLSGFEEDAEEIESEYEV